MAGERSHDTGASWLPDGSLVYVSDADGWFQVVRRSPDGRDRIVLTDGEREHGEPSGGTGYVPLPSPDGSRVVHIEVHDGSDRPRSCAAWATPRRRSAAAAVRPRRREPSRPRPGRERISPWDGVWRAVGWLPDGAWIAAIGESETRPQDLWLLPVPGVAPDGARPRQVTDSRPAVLAAALAPGRVPAGERIAIKARDGLRVEGTLVAPGRRDRQTRRQAGPHDHLSRTVGRPGSPTASFQPFKLLLAREGFAFLDVDFRGSTGYGRAFRRANHDEWGHADVQDLIDAGSLGAGPAMVGRAARDLRRVVRRLHGPVRLVEEPAHVRGRCGPVRRLGDRRELPPRRSTRAPGPAQDDGHARRSERGPSSSAAARRSTAPSASRRRS